MNWRENGEEKVNKEECKIQNIGKSTMNIKKIEKNKAVILDRDGTLVQDTGHVHKAEDFRLLPNVIEGLEKLKKFMLFVVTNQSGIGRGLYKLEDFKKFNAIMVDELERNKIKIEKIYYCPHKPEDNCVCRKPKTKFLKDAAKAYDIDLKKSFVIGDQIADIELGKNGNCKSVLVLTGNGKKTEKEVKADFVAKDLLDAARWILKNG